MKPNQLISIGGEVLTYPQYQSYQELIASGKSHKEAIKMIRESEEKGNTGMLKWILVLLIIVFLFALLGA